MVIVDSNRLTGLSLHNNYLSDATLDFLSSRGSRNRNYRGMFRDVIDNIVNIRKRENYRNRVNNILSDTPISTDGYYIGVDEWDIPEYLKQWVLAHPIIASKTSVGELYGFGIVDDNIEDIRFRPRYGRVLSRWVTDYEEPFIYVTTEDGYEEELEDEMSHSILETWSNAEYLLDKDIDPTES